MDTRYKDHDCVKFDPLGTASVYVKKLDGVAGIVIGHRTQPAEMNRGQPIVRYGDGETEVICVHGDHLVLTARLEDVPDDDARRHALQHLRVVVDERARKVADEEMEQAGHNAAETYQLALAKREQWEIWANRAATFATVAGGLLLTGVGAWIAYLAFTR